MSPLRNVVKRALDLGIAIPALLVLSPLFALLALAVRVFMGSPVFFRQIRPGLNARPFGIYKFRTMTDRKDASGELLPDHERLTAVGRVMRRWSLDEIPQLLNVIKGDLSLVGPRPLLMQYLDLYTPEQSRRHHVKPGITGWAQTNGRNAITWEEKFALDVWYVDHQSILLDLRILWMTALHVFKGTGVEGYGNVPFTGSARPGEREP